MKKSNFEAFNLVADDGCPTSRSFFARCGIPLALTVRFQGPIETQGLQGESRGIPHLAKNERDVGHPSSVVGKNPDFESHGYTQSGHIADLLS